MRARRHAMTRSTTVRAWATIAAAGVGLAGCRRETAAPGLPPPEATGAAAPVTEQPAGGFAPPATLADLDRQVTWVDRPVRDALALSRERDAGEPATCSAAEALALPNDSPEANARILAALSRPPTAGTRVAADAVVRHLRADVGSLNPALAEAAAEFEILELTGVGLFGFDRNLEPFANTDAVTAWRSSTDGLVDKVVLRDDLTWSDGRPLTAFDVAFTWRLLADPRVPARAFRAGARRLRAVRAYDDRTVVFFHEEALATAAWNIDFPVLPRHVYQSTWEHDPTLSRSREHAALEARPVTGGPYEVASRTAGREIVLRRRPGWLTVRGRKVREPPPFAEIRFRVVDDPVATLEALEAGDLDEAALRPEAWMTATADATFAESALRLVTPEWHTLQFAWNLDAPPFTDRLVRRAMGYAFDHGRLLDTLCHGLAAPATGAFPPIPWMPAQRKPDPYRQDLAKAEALLDEAGWVDHDGDGVRDKEIDGRRVPCAFTVHCDREAFDVAVCALLQECLKRVGVACVVRPVEPAELRALVHARSFEACLISCGAGVDPDTAASLWQTDGPLNFCGYANPEVDRLFAAGRRERDRQRRAEHYARIEELLAEDQPCTWLCRQDGLRAFSRRLGGDLFRIRGAEHWSPGLSSIWKPTLE